MLLASEHIKQKQNERIDASETDRWCYWSTECTAETRTFAYDWLLSSFWQNIKHTFKQIGFGSDFVKWVCVLMADAKSCVAYCGWLFEYFQVEAGIRQGCLFHTSLCPCGRTACNKNTTLWEHQRIKLLESKKQPLGKYHKKCTRCRRFNAVFKRWAGYATDTWNLAEFSTFSGLEINRMKSEALWLGSKQNFTDTFFGFVWKRRLKILGVYFAADAQQTAWSKMQAQVKSIYTFIIPHRVLQLTTILFWVSETRLRLPQVNK